MSSRIGWLGGRGSDSSQVGSVDGGGRAAGAAEEAAAIAAGGSCAAAVAACIYNAASDKKMSIFRTSSLNACYSRVKLKYAGS